jgi:hypothetical protein
MGPVLNRIDLIVPLFDRKNTARRECYIAGVSRDVIEAPCDAKLRDDIIKTLGLPGLPKRALLPHHCLPSSGERQE